jgi:Tfp pilus assembly protein PilF
VETVAWVADRKDLLASLFWFLSVWAYVRYCERPGIGRFAPVFVLMAIGVLCKSSLMTLPFALLLLDYWPLSRFQLGQAKLHEDLNFPNSSLMRAIFEKIPLFLLAAIAVLAATMTKGQHIEGLVDRSSLLPDLFTTSHALCSYLTYVVKTFWPFHLATPYPHPKLAPCGEWEVVAGVLLLAIVSATALWQIRKRPYLAVGWLFFLGNLLPVIGFFKIGPVKMADRYTYISLIGLFVMVVFYLNEQGGRARFFKSIRAAIVVIVFLGLMTTAFMQTRHWKDTFSLFKHAILHTRNNALAHNNLGIEYMHAGDMQKAVDHFQKALAIRPHYPNALVNVGVVLQRQGKLQEAKVFYRRALETRPGYAAAHYNLGWALEQSGKFDQAEYHYRSALKAMPDYHQAHNNLGVLMAHSGRFHEAAKHFRKALKIEPQDSQSLNNLGGALQKSGKTREAKKYYLKALSLDRDNTHALFNLTGILEIEGDLNQAETYYHRILDAFPYSAEALLGLGRVAESQGKHDLALDYYQKALKQKPDFRPAKNRLLRLLEKNGPPRAYSK